MSGCCLTRPGGELVLGPAYKPTNVYAAGEPLPYGFRRVALLPLHCAPGVGEGGQATLEPVLQEELRRTKRFELVIISPQELKRITGAQSLAPQGALPGELLPAIQEKFGCDGVFLPELTEYRAYPPLAAGWNLKLVDTRSRQVMWAADEVFDAGQSTVANGARRFQMARPGLDSALSDSHSVLLSPTAFGHYSVECLCRALPAEAPAQVFAPLADTQGGNSASH